MTLHNDSASSNWARRFTFKAARILPYGGVDSRSLFFLSALSFIYGWSFMAMYMSNRTGATGDELVVVMRALVELEYVGSALQTRLLVPHLFTYLNLLVGTFNTVLAMETLSFFLASLGLFRCISRYSSLRDEKLLIATAFGMFTFFWSIQQPGRVGDLMGLGLLLMALGSASKPASLPFAILLTLQRLDLALVFIIIVAVGTLFEVINRTKNSHFGELTYVLSYWVIFVVYALMVYLYLRPESGIIDNPGLYEGPHLKLT